MDKLLRRLWKHIEPEPNSGCWIWMASLNDNGYGLCQAIGQGLAHRVSYVVHRGPIPTGLFVDHLCRVRCCVNPRHMELVTHAENTRRGIGMSVRWARRTVCAKGHPLDGVRKNGRGRYCRTCNREECRRKYEQRRRRIVNERAEKAQEEAA